MPPTVRQLFGPLHVLPPSQLADEDGIYRQLNTSGSPFEVEQRLIAGRMQTVYKNLPGSVGDFWMACAKGFARRPYIVFEDERLTYADVWERSLAVASCLQRNFQVRKGDRVGIAARNYPEFVVTYWAIALLGGVATILNSFHDGETLAFSIRDVSCRVVVCDGERYERLRDHLGGLLDSNGGQASSAASTIGEAQQADAHARFAALVVLPWMGSRKVREPSEKPWLAHELANKSIFDWQELMERTGRVHEIPVVSIKPDDNACILFTSGTTGRPKGVLSTQRQHLSCLRLATFGQARALLRRRRPLPPPPDPSSMEQGSMLILVPLTHTTGLQSGLSLGTAAGSKIVLMAAYKRDKAIQIAKSEGIQSLLGIGFMVREIALAGVALPQLGAISHGGSSSAKELPGEVAKSHPETITSAGYGLTEVNGVAAHIMSDDYLARPTSAGRPPLGVELMIVDPSTGLRVQDGERGELWIRTPGRAMGYWNRPRETAEAFLPDGWFRSGDLAKIDGDGFVYIVDRVKDIIVRGGENISCTHVESAAYAYPAILDCAAVSLPDDRLGERVGLVCIPKTEHETSLPREEDILETLSKTLPRYALPDYIWVRTEPLERNPNGKVLRYAVRQSVLERIKKQGWKPGQAQQEAGAARSKL